MLNRCIGGGGGGGGGGGNRLAKWRRGGAIEKAVEFTGYQCNNQIT